MRQRARHAIFSVAATAILFALASSDTSGEVLIEVDLSQANKIIFNATEGSSLATRALAPVQIILYDDLLKGLDIVGGPPFGTDTLSNQTSGNLTYAQAPGNQFISLSGKDNDDGLLMISSGPDPLLAEGERAFIGSQEFTLSSSVYNSILSSAPLSGDLFAFVSPFDLNRSDNRLIGQYEVNGAGFLGASIELQVETVTNSGLIVTEPREAVVSNLSDEFADFDNVPLFDESGSPRGDTGVGVDIDLTYDTIRIDNYSEFALFGSGGFNGYVFTDTAGEVPPIVGVEIDPSTTLNISAGDISFTADEIRVDIGGQIVNTSTQILLNVEFGEDLPLEGDYNGDGQVDAADYTVWRDSLGQTGTGLAADGIQDNVIDQADYNLWRNNFGQRVSVEAAVASQSASSATTIPEPTTLGLLCLGGALLGRGRVVRLAR